MTDMQMQIVWNPSIIIVSVTMIRTELQDSKPNKVIDVHGQQILMQTCVGLNAIGQ